MIAVIIIINMDINKQMNLFNHTNKSLQLVSGSQQYNDFRWSTVLKKYVTLYIILSVIFRRNHDRVGRIDMNVFRS